MPERWRRWAGFAVAALYTAAAFLLAARSDAGCPSPCLLMSLAAGAALVAHRFCWRPGLAMLGLSVCVLLGLRGPAVLASNGGRIQLAVYLLAGLLLIKLAERLCRNTSFMYERYRLLVESAFDGILLADDRGAILWANSRAAEIFGRSLGEILQLSLCELLLLDDARSLCQRLRRGGGVLSECTGRRKDGSQVPVEISVQALSSGWMLLIVRDESERERAEEQLRESLREKEMLLREIHHRVKNNLQIISSIFQLQARHIQDPAMLEPFRDSLERVRSIALLHETLYRGRDLGRVDLASYAEALVRQLAVSYGCAGRIAVRAEVEPIELDLDTAMPCGLILCELVTNAFRHAFPGGRQGEVVVRARREGESISLVVSDDGVGLPESVDLKNAPTLGMRLVAALARQLGARVTLGTGRGAEITLTFQPKVAGGRRDAPCKSAGG
ncbi:MAG: sensor histidine kinase [Bryobacteraceae bacterium]